MAWVKLDDRRALNAKLRKAGLAARGLDEAAMCWVAHEGTDGFVSAEDVEMLANAHGCRRWGPLADALVEAGRWEWDQEGAGYWVHDWLEFNPSAATAQERREVRARAGRAGGRRSGETRRSRSKNEANASASGEANASASGEANASASGEANANPVPVPLKSTSPRTTTSDSCSGVPAGGQSLTTLRVGTHVAEVGL